jgi:hypothetical protein
MFAMLRARGSTGATFYFMVLRARTVEGLAVA